MIFNSFIHIVLFAKHYERTSRQNEKSLNLLYYVHVKRLRTCLEWNLVKHAIWLFMESIHSYSYFTFLLATYIMPCIFMFWGKIEVWMSFQQYPPFSYLDFRSIILPLYNYASNIISTIFLQKSQDFSYT